MKKFCLLCLSLIFILTGCSKSNILMKIGDVTVTEEYINYFEKVYNNQPGGIVSDAAKKNAKLQAEKYAQYAAIGHALKLDVSAVYNEMIADLEKNQGSPKEIMERLDISNYLFEFVMYGDAYRAMLVNMCKSENDITEEMENKYFMDNYWRAKHLLITTQGKSENEIKLAENKINEIFQQIKNGANFDKLIEEHNEDPGVKTNPDGYIFTKGEMVSEFENGVKNSKIGEYKVVKTSYGYHIVRRLALDETPELYEKFITEKISQINNAIVNDIFVEYVDNKLKELDIKTIDYTEETK